MYYSPRTVEGRCFDIFPLFSFFLFLLFSFSRLVSFPPFPLFPNISFPLLYFIKVDVAAIPALRTGDRRIFLRDDLRRSATNAMLLSRHVNRGQHAQADVHIGDKSSTNAPSPISTSMSDNSSDLNADVNVYAGCVYR